MRGQATRLPKLWLLFEVRPHLLWLSGRKPAPTAQCCAIPADLAPGALDAVAALMAAQPRMGATLAVALPGRCVRGLCCEPPLLQLLQPATIKSACTSGGMARCGHTAAACVTCHCLAPARPVGDNRRGSGCLRASCSMRAVIVCSTGVRVRADSSKSSRALTIQLQPSTTASCDCCISARMRARRPPAAALPEVPRRAPPACAPWQTPAPRLCCAPLRS